MHRLPISGAEVAVRLPDGADELALYEAEGSSVSAALSLLARLAHPASGEAMDWGWLTVTDFEWLMALLRQRVVGPVLQCGFACPHSGCGERVELAIPIEAYLAPVRPSRPRGVAPIAGREGWFHLEDSAFRLPTAADQEAALYRPDGARLLAERCIEGEPRMRSRIERAMAAMAPEVSRPIAGVCPACGAAVRAGLHLPTLVMAELRRAAGWVLDDVHLLASAYGWNEATILALPGPRRQDYARRIRRLAA
jgi:hypothetical protein